MSTNDTDLDSHNSGTDSESDIPGGGIEQDGGDISDSSSVGNDESDNDTDNDDNVSDDGLDDELDYEDEDEDNEVSSMSDRLKAHDNEERKTSMFMTSYELTRIIGIRAIMIRDGAPPSIDIGLMDDPFDIAYAELAAGKCPLNIKRPVPVAGGIKEDTISANQLINVNQRV